jgi:AcrR family transcriptional regulator
MTTERRTQAERTADTTARLLDATAASLVEVGYANTTTTEVCRRAGVSRGALLHHYPTKDELVAAAVSHIVDLRVEEFRVTLGSLPDTTSIVDRLETAIDVLWGIFHGDTAASWIELAVASRTDEWLRQRMIEVEKRLDEQVAQAWADLFPEDGELPSGFYDTAPAFLFALLDGLAVQQMTGSPTAADNAAGVLLTVKLIVRTMADLDPAVLDRQIAALLEELT